jgi:hypothetical protein
VSTLRQVLAVTDNTGDVNLQYVPKDEIERLYPDTPDVGSACFWYFNSSTSIGVYPANTSSTFEVFYIKNGTDLSTGTDTPDMPSRYHGLIVDLAAYRGYLHRDNPEIAANLRSHVDRQLAQMESDLLSRTNETDFILLPETW